MTVSGFNFGVTTPTVTIGGWACVVSASTHTMIRCTAPQGAGMSVPVTVTVQGQSATARVFSYEPYVVVEGKRAVRGPMVTALLLPQA